MRWLLARLDARLCASCQIRNLELPVIPVSVVIITKNEAQRIGECLASVADLADEIVVLDSGSSDGTQALCAARGARVVACEWLGFGPQKDLAVRTARNDWVLCVDADERVSVDLAGAIRSALADKPAFPAYRCARGHRLGDRR